MFLDQGIEESTSGTLRMSRKESANLALNSPMLIKVIINYNLSNQKTHFYCLLTSLHCNSYRTQNGISNYDLGINLIQQFYIWHIAVPSSKLDFLFVEGVENLVSLNACNKI